MEMVIDAVQARWETLQGVGQTGAMRMYVVRPATEGTYPTVIVIHEAFGLDEHMRDMALRFAREGYIAVAPDLFSLDEVGRTIQPQELHDMFALRSRIPLERRREPEALQEEINKLPEQQAVRMRQIATWSANRNMSGYVEALRKTLEWVRQMDGATGKVGMTGYCMGGGVTLQAAFAGLPIDAAAPYYGSNPPLDQANQVRCPLLLIYGRKDPFIIPQVPALVETIVKADLDFGLHIYEEAGHAFLNDMRPTMYNAEAASDAWYLTLDFFARHLEA